MSLRLITSPIEQIRSCYPSAVGDADQQVVGGDRAAFVTGLQGGPRPYFGLVRVQG